MLRSSRKSQITLFILFGFIVLIVVGLIFYVSSSGKRADFVDLSEIPSDVLPVYTYADECLKEVVPDGIYLLAAKGGYIYNYANVVYSENIQVAYHMEYSDDSVAPEKGFMEYELSRYVEDAFKVCVNYFEPFDYYDFEFGEIEVRVSFENEKVDVNVHYPVTVIIDDSRTEISDYYAEFPVRMGHILDVKDQVLTNLKNTGKIGFSLLSSFDVEINMMPFDKQTLVYSIYDDMSEIGEKPFLFNFAVRVYGNNAPVLEFIPDFVLTKDKTFEYQLEAFDQNIDDELRYYSDSGLVEMDETTGEFSFTPLVAGDYEVEFCVEDNYLAKDCDVVRFMIKDEE